MFESIAWAMPGMTGGAGGAEGGGGGMGAFLPLILMFAIFYFLLIRPQQKKSREHKEMLSHIQAGQLQKLKLFLHKKLTKKRVIVY